MQNRRNPPQAGQSPREIANRCSPSVPPPTAFDHVHLLHQLIVSEVRAELIDTWIVEREEGESPTAIPPPQAVHLPATELAVSVVDHHIGVGTFGRCWQR